MILLLVHRACSAVSPNAFSDVQVKFEASSFAAPWSRSLELTSKMSEASPLTVFWHEGSASIKLWREICRGWHECGKVSGLNRSMLSRRSALLKAISWFPTELAATRPPTECQRSAKCLPSSSNESMIACVTLTPVPKSVRLTPKLGRVSCETCEVDHGRVMLQYFINSTVRDKKGTSIVMKSDIRHCKTESTPEHWSHP